MQTDSLYARTDLSRQLVKSLEVVLEIADGVEWHDGLHSRWVGGDVFQEVHWVHGEVSARGSRGLNCARFCLWFV